MIGKTVLFKRERDSYQDPMRKGVIMDKFLRSSVAYVKDSMRGNEYSSNPTKVPIYTAEDHYLIEEEGQLRSVPCDFVHEIVSVE